MNTGKRFDDAYGETIRLADRRSLHIRLIHPTEGIHFSRDTLQADRRGVYLGALASSIPSHVYAASSRLMLRQICKRRALLEEAALEPA